MKTFSFNDNISDNKVFVIILIGICVVMFIYAYKPGEKYEVNIADGHCKHTQESLADYVYTTYPNYSKKTFFKPLNKPGISFNNNNNGQYANLYAPSEDGFL